MAKKTWPPTVRFYYRTTGGIDTVYTYHDYLVLENYVNKMYRLNELVEIAHSYLDTAKGDLRIKGVTFLGEVPGTHLPLGRYSGYSEHRKFQVVDISFKQSSNEKDSAGLLKKDVGFVGFWNKGEATLDISFPTLDSLLKANPLLDNGN